MKKWGKLLLRIVMVLFIVLNIIIAFHAYKFTHFYEAADAGPQSKLSAMLLGINAYKQKNTVADTAAQKVILKTSDKIKLDGWYTPVDGAIGTVCLFHGHGGDKSGTNAEAAAFRQMGYNTFQLDFRAHGASQGNTCTIGYYESEDVELAYRFIKDKGEKNIVLWGISMGAATITKAINDYAIHPSKIILEMPFGSILDAAEGRLRMMHLPGEPFGRLLIFWGGVEHGFWAFNMKPEAYVKKISSPVLLQWGRNDPRVTQSEIETIFGNLNTEKKLVIYDNSGHESLCKKEHDKWMQEVTAFLSNTTVNLK
ncbi:MAG: alpha/beta hydrolase [Bacteroidetes bacterium]|nr:alpha/beta hydrolase [Bacteroidota bacterium]